MSIRIRIGGPVGRYVKNFEGLFMHLVVDPAKLSLRYFNVKFNTCQVRNKKKLLKSLKTRRAHKICHCRETTYLKISTLLQKAWIIDLFCQLKLQT